VKIFDQPGMMREQLDHLRAESKTIGFVPTMGGLHEGHLSLVRQAKSVADAVVVSIFINPLQFGANEDLDAYPRKLEDDLQQLEQLDTDMVFTPTPDTMYPLGLEAQTKVLVPDLTTVLCGASRPGHFDGVSTVVCKLFNIVGPNTAVFGQKDLQQLLIIKRLVADLALPVTVIGHPTTREADGLAMSSRNTYLNEDQRAIAPTLYQSLSEAVEAIKNGSRDYPALEKGALTTLEKAGFAPDYIEIRRSTDLIRATEADEDIAIFGAARLGTTRLIDNIVVSTG
jgi:pantoate--beta-alanine ligase